MGLQIAFWAFSLLAVSAAAAVVWQKNLFRAALMLVVCFFAVAGIFVTLSADFLAVVQVVINVGAVAVIVIMSIMLTHEVTHGNPSNRLSLPALLFVGMILAAIVFTVFNFAWPVSNASPAEPTTPVLAELLLGNGRFILLVELAGVLLLTTMMGAIVLLREKE